MNSKIPDSCLLRKTYIFSVGCNLGRRQMVFSEGVMLTNDFSNPRDLCCLLVQNSQGCVGFELISEHN